MLSVFLTFGRKAQTSKLLEELDGDKQAFISVEAESASHFSPAKLYYETGPNPVYQAILLDRCIWSRSRKVTWSRQWTASSLFFFDPGVTLHIFSMTFDIENFDFVDFDFRFVDHVALE